jgi:hypothetical protein
MSQSEGKKDLYVNNLSTEEAQSVLDEATETGADLRSEQFLEMARNSRTLRRIKGFLESLDPKENVMALIVSFKQSDLSKLPLNKRKAQDYTKLVDSFPDLPDEMVIEFVNKIENYRVRQQIDNQVK